MKITMLGTGNATVTECYNTCFVLSGEGKHLLVDGGGGNTVLRRLKQAGTDWKDIRDIFVTHKHIDHLLGIIWMARMICQNMSRGTYDGEARIYAHDEVIALIDAMARKLLGAKESAFIGKRLHLITVGDGEEREIIGRKFAFFDILSTKAKQYGFCMDLGGGEPYAYMLKEFFPGLRRVEITVSYDLRRIMEEKLHRKLDEAEFETALSKERAAAEAEERRLAELERQKQQAQQAAEQAARMAAERAALAERQRQREAEQARMEAQRQAAEAARLQAEREAAEAARLQRQEERKLYPLAGVKTNLLAWTGLLPDFKTAAFMPNLEAEFYFAGRWSVSASALYADWEYGGGKQFWGISSYSMEPRFWFRDDGLFRGFFVGVYGEAGDFNDQKDRRDDAATATNYTGTFWSAGVSAGYLLPLSRHWGLELSLRVGYRGAKYDVYDRELPYLYYNYSDKENKFTLTGLRLNVVYRFGHGRP